MLLDGACQQTRSTNSGDGADANNHHGSFRYCLMLFNAHYLEQM